MLNDSFQADWQFVEKRKQRLDLQNNKHENSKQTPHTHSAGDVGSCQNWLKAQAWQQPLLGPTRDCSNTRQWRSLSSSRSPKTTAELSLRCGTPGTLNRTWPDHPCVAHNVVSARLQPHDTSAPERLSVSSLSAFCKHHLSHLTCLSWGRMQHPQCGMTNSALERDSHS